MQTHSPPPRLAGPSGVPTHLCSQSRGPGRRTCVLSWGGCRGLRNPETLLVHWRLWTFSTPSHWQTSWWYLSSPGSAMSALRVWSTSVVSRPSQRAVGGPLRLSPSELYSVYTNQGSPHPSLSPRCALRTRRLYGAVNTGLAQAAWLFLIAIRDD